jgi:hypothetical protein
MTLPFTVDEFLSVFEQYNRAIWPTQVGVYLAAVVLLGWTLWRPSRNAGRALTALLALCWVLMGAGYHLGYFRAISGVALPAGVLFLATGLGFAWVTARGSLSFAWRRDAWAIFGMLLVLYAMVGYPLVGWAAGQRYPRMPVFGVVPCPTSIFTFGVLLLASTRVPGWLLVVPAAWSIFATSAALLLGITEDLALPVAAVGGTVGILVRNRALRRAAAPA